MDLDKFFHEFPEAVFDGVVWNRYDTPTTSNRAIPPTSLENPCKTCITIDSIVGWRSNFLQEFLEVVFDGVAWNGYDTATASGRGHSTDSAREPGQMVHNDRSDRWIATKFFHEFPEAVFDGLAWNRYETPTASERAIPPTLLENQGKRFITIDPTIGSRQIFSRVSGGCLR